MASTASTSKNGPQQAFEFTKRKRWADLLITELAEAVILVLSSTGKVLYCGPAVTELLGWKDVDLVDHPVYDIINGEDQESFRTSFNDSVKDESELLSYVHLICKDKFVSGADYETSPKQILFEFKGYPHFLTDSEDHPACFFAVAKPYPSRNTAMLNTFLELKMENERLQQRVKELKDASSTSHFPRSNNPTYGGGAASSSYLPPPTLSISTGGYDDPARSGPFSGAPAPFSAAAPSPIDDEGTEEGGKKKKVKKSHNAEQHVCVTCGRTDSPEWRKGPLGPKTLCNACGLRYAKQMRKTDEPSADNGEA